METTYQTYIGPERIGTTRLEKGDAPMGVVTGLIEFIDIEEPYRFFKDYCSKSNVTIGEDDPKFGLILVPYMPDLRVFREDGYEIKGVGGNVVYGMQSEGYEISILGIEYPFYKKEFPHHVKAYEEMYKK